MKASIKLIVLPLLLTFMGCAIGKQDIYYEEMSKEPVLSVKDNVLTIKTGNSKKNSALLIYRINISVDQGKKEIYLSADQALGKPYRETFIIELGKHKISDPSTYSFYWLDPDKHLSKLEALIE